jgi:SAM-dependent methyltransferase
MGRSAHLCVQALERSADERNARPRQAGPSRQPAHPGRCRARIRGYGLAMSACDCGSRIGRRVAAVRERRYGFPGEFELVRCGGCGLVRTDPQPENPLAYYPGDEYYSFKAPAPPTRRVRRRFQDAYGHSAGRRRIARATARWLSPGMPPGPPGAILDVGCGSGEFLLSLQAAGWEVHGIEVSERAVHAAHESGLEAVDAGELPDTPPGARYDVIRFWHALEHVESPAAQLEAARERLQKGGRLVLGVPNLGSLAARLSIQNWFYLDVPRHLWHFEPRTLVDLVERCGFRVESVRLESTATPVLGTIDYLAGWGERLVSSRKAWYVGLPIAVALDVLKHGDAITLIAARN